MNINETGRQDEPKTPADNADATRRRLIKASAAAPLVATLTPNSALALSSAAGACAGGDFSNKKFAKNGNSINGDTAVRYAVPYYQKKSGNNRTGWANKLYEIDREYYDQDGGTHPCTREGLRDYYDKDTAHVLALFDVSEGDARFVGLWPKVQIHDMYATPMTGSCWTSLNGGDLFDPA